VPQLQSSLLKYWVLTSMPDEVEGVHEARPLGFPPNWPTQRGWQGFDFREDGKFSFFTFAANDGRLELVGWWEPEPDSGHIHVTLPKDTGDAHTDLGVSEESFTGFTLEIVALEDELLKARILEEVPADDAQLAGDVNAGVAFFRVPAIWPRNDDALP
jgi:hypothetical protein